MKEKVFKIKESYFERKEAQEFIDIPFIEQTLEEWKGDHESWSDEFDGMKIEFTTWEDFKLILEEVEND